MRTEPQEIVNGEAVGDEFPKLFLEVEASGVHRVESTGEEIVRLACSEEKPAG